MSIHKTSITLPKAPSQEPASGTAVTAVALPADHSQPFDFRSAQFGADAQALARATGQSEETCRQELFIAEGDMVLAHEWLTAGYAAQAAAPTLH